MSTSSSSSSSVILSKQKLGFQWQTEDPFLFCVHHDDAYPEGHPDNLGLKNRALLKGRDMGMDFTEKHGFRYYHGQVVPGFPQHPHCGFETLTLVRHGFIDHSDSEGAQARYGFPGDVQWLTAGKGISHAEMFPLLQTDAGNRCELFQIWINLPKKDKRVDPHFTMLWAEDIPKLKIEEDGKVMVEVAVVAHSDAELPLPVAKDSETQPPNPPPHSYASSKESSFDVWTIKMAPGAKWTMPPTNAAANRNLYYFLGDEVVIAGQKVTSAGLGLKLKASEEVPIENTGKSDAEFLLLSAVPIGEPVVQHGPFVGNTRQDIMRAYDEYRSGVFGQWPFDSDEPVHGRQERFAKYPDGNVLKPPTTKEVEDESKRKDEL